VDLITIDFETYYDTEYSLSRITTEAYIRSDQFEVIGVSIKVNDGPTDWYSGDEVGAFLKSLDYSDKAILCHHTAFDGAILSWVYGIKPKLWFDTMSMAKPKHAATIGVSLKALALAHGLGAKGTEVVEAKGMHRKDFTPAGLKRYGDYCINDTELCYALFKKLQVGFPVSELLVIDQLIRMYTEPMFELDRPLLSEHLAAVRTRKQKLLDRLGGADEAKAMLMSNPKFASLLEALGAVVPMKISPRTGKEAYAFAKTDQGLLDLLDDDNPAVAIVVEARLGVKSTIEETRTERLIQVSERGPLPIMLNYYGAHTGRFSGGDKLNLQNLPARQGNVIRTALVAPKGHKVVACDSSQIEARVLALLAGQKDLLEAFREGRDIYKEFASKIYGVGVDHVDGKQRFVGKTCVAKGTPVLTRRGNIPIEDITLEDRLWDGVEWVTHAGVVYQGEKDAITYGGLTATPDHGVFTSNGAVPFGVAASRLETLTTTEHGGEAVRASGSYFQQNTAPWEEHIRVRTMYEMWQQEMDIVQLHLDDKVSSGGPFRGGDTRTVRVYDILDAGPRRRYTAGGVLILNCILGLGYGMGHEKFHTTMHQSKIDMHLQEAFHIVKLYRNTYPMIPKLWNKCDGVLQDMIASREGRIGNLLDYGPEGIQLPNGMAIRYNGLCVRDNGVSYLGNPREYRKLAKRLVAGTKEDINWTDIYGGKVTENVVQALARIVTSEQMTRLKHEYGIPVALQVHDENITIQPDDKAEWAQQVMEQVMSVPPAWAPTLPVACESAIGANYGECK